MYCQNHPNKESVATCEVCGKSICDDCGLNIAGNDYCHECVTEIVATEAPKRTKTQETLANNSDQSLEKKYEKYLDELYYKEDNVSKNQNNVEIIPLKEQLAKDEAEHGSIISKPRKPVDPTPDKKTLQNRNDKIDLKSVKVNDQNRKKRRSLHPHIQNERKKKNIEGESTSTEIILTIILIFMIILVVTYIIYLFTLAHAYPNFFDAVYTLFSNPAEIINNIFS